jgi:SPP1 gp7 family putative phage head morphogenesis protein
MPPRNLNQQIQTLLLRRAVMQTRYENEVLRTLRPYWRDAQASMLAAVRGAGISGKEAGPAALLQGLTTRVDQQQRVHALMVQLIGIWRYAVDRAVHTLHTSLVDFAELELIEVPQAIQALLDTARLPDPLREAGEDEPLSGVLSATFTQVPAAQIAQLLTSPLGGAFFAQSFGDLSAQVLAQLRNALNLGLLQGQGIPAVTRAVMAVMGSSRWKAERIVRSEFGRVAAQAAQLQFKQNERLLRGVRWLATLDQRTCVQCGALDGREWADPAAAPVPVVSTHPQCRCVLIPVIKGLPGVEFPTSTRASMDGQVSAKLTYKDWFGQQDAEFQRGVLGPTRYRLWKSGALKLGDFSTATGVRSVKSALALARSRV